MAGNKESVDSISSFVFEEEPILEAKKDQIYAAKEPRRVEITVEPEKMTKCLEVNPDKSDVEISHITPAIQDAINFDLTNVSYEEILANNMQLRYLLYRTSELLKEKGGLCRNLEKQIKTLELQAKSLKDLVFMTKDLLSVRNLEVLSLRTDIKNMEEKINQEKEKHKHMLSNMNETVKAITKMKEEHKMQMELIEDLQNEYEKKILLLEKENKWLSRQMSEDPLSCQVMTEKVGEGDSKGPDDTLPK